MLLTAYLLALLAVLLAWPVPVALSRARWTSRSPFAAMVLWQSIALAGGLSMIGAMLVYGLEPLGDNLVHAVRRAAGIVAGNRSSAELPFWHFFALCAAALLGTHLVFTLGLTYARITTQRRRHRELLGVLSSPSGAMERTLVISHPAPVAYCLPGGSRSVTVLSDGLMEVLTPEELAAVVDHERAHLTQRHHLLLWAFEAWRQALPWLPTTRLSRQAVSSLVEMLADDVARRTSQDEVLVRAIALVALGRSETDQQEEGTAATPSAADDRSEGGMPDEGEASLASRVSRLLSPRPPLGAGARTAVLAASALLLAVPTVLLLAPGLAG
ncbi:M56 family metallopeptidase [Sinomonas sp. JGH33]|uniref:M56 family metallopeptidase n=1 Tax=Sinomonas terricola TaxID=3110330 RepID=A0ABU5T3L1_9MICC|nr:M56 family metallopeptidase [Sinomonas sp. JGH33]MEA5454258.1 M56 family metallopeptidase [Sinomonas sp. JGH33]